jgi:hypothetical protein
VSAVRINDRFIQLMAQNEPEIYGKISDSQFGVVRLETGEYQAFFTPGTLSTEEKLKIQPLFWQAINEFSTQ